MGVDQCFPDPPRRQVTMFGSYAMGLGCKGSDVDIVVQTTGKKVDRDEAAHILASLGDVLERSDTFEVLEMRLHVRVPILKLKFNRQVAVDVTASLTSVALAEVRLLKS